MARRLDDVPSVPTIWRILKARGFVTSQPHKRPRSSWVRFEADLPNERWQADVTHVQGADCTVFEVLNIIDDRSRLCVASRAFAVVRAPDVVRTVHRAGQKWGYPAELLSDNGLIFSTERRHLMAGALEVDTTGYKVRHDKVDKKGGVTLRHDGRLHHIGVGAPYAGWRVIMLVAGLDIQVIGFDGSPLRHLRLDPTKDYQPIG